MTATYPQAPCHSTSYNDSSAQSSHTIPKTAPTCHTHKQNTFTYSHNRTCTDNGTCTPVIYTCTQHTHIHAGVLVPKTVPVRYTQTQNTHIHAAVLVPKMAPVHENTYMKHTHILMQSYLYPKRYPYAIHTQNTHIFTPPYLYPKTVHYQRPLETYLPF